MPRLSVLLCLLFLPLGCEASRQEWPGLYAMTGTAHYSIPGLGHLSSPVSATWRVWWEMASLTGQDCKRV